MPRSPIRPQKGLPQVTTAGNVNEEALQRAFDQAETRIKSLEEFTRDTELSSSVRVLSGSVDSAIHVLSGSDRLRHPGHFRSARTHVRHDGRDPLRPGHGRQSSLRGDAQLLDRLLHQVRHRNVLSGTVNSRILNLTGSLISGLSKTYSSLQAGVTASD
jgi:hypothetical protein